MADTYTLADLMRERREGPAQHGTLGSLGQFPPQDFDALENSLPPIPPPTWGTRAHQAHDWITRNVLEEAQHAAFYPLRVFSRYMDPSGTNTFYNPQPRGQRMDHPTHGVMPVYEEISRMGTYTPSGRMSDNIEDRRPRSIWDYR